MKSIFNTTKAILTLIFLMPIMILLGLGSLKDVTEKLAAKGKIISQIYTEAGEDLDFSKVKCLEGDTTAKVEALKAIDAEVTELREEHTQLLDAEKTLKAGQELNKEMTEPAQAMKHPDEGAKAAVEVKSLGELFMESKAFTEKGREAFLDVDLKATMTAAAGWDPPLERLVRYEEIPARPIVVAAYFPQYTTKRDTIKYMLESTFDRQAAGKAEAGAYNEASIALTQQSITVEKLGVWLPVTDEQLEDVSGLAQYVNRRLVNQVLYHLDGKILEGDGSSNSLVGTLNAPGTINAQAKSTDSGPDAIYKSFTQIRTVGFAEPSVLFINPNDWQKIRLLTTSDGVYIFGSPTDTGQDRIWGVPVVQTMAVSAGTRLGGDYRNYAGLFWRRGITMKVTDSHGTYFTENIQAIKADIRLACVHFRAKAFGKITGM